MINFRKDKGIKLTDDLFVNNKKIYKALFLNSPTGIALSNPSGDILKVNSKYCDFLGYSESELLQMTYQEITPLKDWQSEVSKFYKFYQTVEDGFRLQKRYIHKSKKIVWADVFLSFIRSPKTNELQYVIAVVNDITAQKSIEKELHESQEKLKAQNIILEDLVYERTKELAEKNEKLVSSLSLLKSFAYASSHDLKEPIRTISSFASLIKRKYAQSLDAKGLEYLDYISQSITRMSDLTNSVLNLAMVNQDKVEFSGHSPLDLIKNVTNDISLKIKETNTKVTILNLPEKIICNPEQFGLVFSNLINNGIKYNKQSSPEINISSTENDSHYLFTVKDNGIGISDEYKKSIFKLFKRLHNQHDYSGSGIGLSLCQKIIENHKGTIHVDSIEGKGSEFIFSISKKLTSS